MKRKKYSLSNLDFTTAIHFDNVYYTLKELSLESIDGNISSYAGAGQQGVTITSRQYASRDVTLTGYVLADNPNSMRARKMQLQKMVAPTSDFFLVVDDKYKMRLTAKASIEYKSDFYLHNEQLTMFTVEAVAANPFFTTINDVDAELSGWIKDFHFRKSFPKETKFTFGHKAPSKIIEVENKGEVETGGVIRFQAINGIIVNPYLENIDTGERFSLTATLPNNNVVAINTIYGSKSVVNETTDDNWLTKMNLESVFLQIPVGISSFKYGFDEEQSTGTMRTTIHYTPQLFEV